MNGKEKCRLLRQIRREIAEKNGIPYEVEECTYQGDDCAGTCPKCDAELEWLEAELAKRAEDGMQVDVSGVNAVRGEMERTAEEEIRKSIAGKPEFPGGYFSPRAQARMWGKRLMERFGQQRVREYLAKNDPWTLYQIEPERMDYPDAERTRPKSVATGDLPPRPDRELEQARRQVMEIRQNIELQANRLRRLALGLEPEKRKAKLMGVVDPDCLPRSVSEEEE